MTGMVGYYTCDFRDPCDGLARSFACNSGSWTDLSPKPLPAAKCPVTKPANGSDCSACIGRYPGDCTYVEPPCGGMSMSSLAMCDAKTGKWNVGISTCNPPPPPPDAGP